jgi:hypothetical protein
VCTAPAGSLSSGIFSLVLLLGQQLGGALASSPLLPVIGVGIGGVVGMCFNLFFSKN